MNQHMETWCASDDHQDFELFEEFNSWIDQGEIPLNASILKQLGEVGLSHPSKAFYAGDKEAYHQTLRAFRLEGRHDALSKEYLIEAFGQEDGQHWYERNETRLEQLVEQLAEGIVIPFIGAGISVGGGFPTWTDHLRQQARTAGLDPNLAEEWLDQGKFEQLIDHIEQSHGPDVFAQEIRDVFSRTGSIQDITLRISELFQDTLITTNYDRLLEQVFDTGTSTTLQVINGVNAMEPPDPEKTTILKIHGDVRNPRKCILGKAQYDDAYGNPLLDLNRPIPKALAYYYKNSSLLFIGCSLRNDRTIQVFEAVKIQAGDTLIPQHFAIEQTPEDLHALTARNAELLRLGITAIWIPPGQYEKVDVLLRHLVSEINYRKAKVLF